MTAQVLVRSKRTLSVLALAWIGAGLGYGAWWIFANGASSVIRLDAAAAAVLVPYLVSLYAVDQSIELRETLLWRLGLVSGVFCLGLVGALKLSFLLAFALPPMGIFLTCPWRRGLVR